MDENPHPTKRLQRAILAALNADDGRKHVYAGTANRKKVAAARRRSRLAKVSRRANRGRS